MGKKKSKKKQVMADESETKKVSHSFALANCAVAFEENDKGAYSFEITEKVHSSLMMGKTTSRKMQVRVQSKDKEKEWIAALKADKCEMDSEN